MRLPDLPQHHPQPEVLVHPDFYYQRAHLTGICVFVDGPHHDQPGQAAHDREVREALQNLGFRIIAIRHDNPIQEQVAEHPEVFGEHR